MWIALEGDINLRISIDIKLGWVDVQEETQFFNNVGYVLILEWR